MEDAGFPRTVFSKNQVQSPNRQSFPIPERLQIVEADRIKNRLVFFIATLFPHTPHPMNIALILRFLQSVAGKNLATPLHFP